MGSIPGLGRAFGEGKGYCLQHSGLENSMDYIVHGVTKSQTQLSLSLTLLLLIRNHHIYPQLMNINFASWSCDSLFTADIHSCVVLLLSVAYVNSFLAFSTLFPWAELTNNLTDSLKAGGSNGENGEVRDQGGYHHGTKETIFDFGGFNDIIFSFAPVTFPLEFFSLWFFAANLPTTVLPTLSFPLSPPVPFSNSVLVY